MKAKSYFLKDTLASQTTKAPFVSENSNILVPTLHVIFESFQRPILPRSTKWLAYSNLSAKARLGREIVSLWLDRKKFFFIKHWDLLGSVVCSPFWTPPPFSQAAAFTGAWPEYEGTDEGVGKGWMTRVLYENVRAWRRTWQTRKVWDVWFDCFGGRG